jgi:hypothetical protein
MRNLIIYRNAPSLGVDLFPSPTNSSSEHEPTQPTIHTDTHYITTRIILLKVKTTIRTDTYYIEHQPYAHTKKQNGRRGCKAVARLRDCSLLEMLPGKLLTWVFKTTQLTKYSAIQTIAIHLRNATHAEQPSVITVIVEGLPHVAVVRSGAAGGNK